MDSQTPVTGRIVAGAASTSAEGSRIVVHVPMRLKRHSGRKEIVFPTERAADQAASPNAQRALIVAVARAHAWLDALEEGRYANVAAAAKQALGRLIEQSAASHAGIYVDTIVSPTFKTAVAQIVQIPGVSGLDNNSILFDFREGDDSALPELADGCHFASVTGFNIAILRSSDRHFGYKRRIHIWLADGDYRNANLMILLAYILIGHPEWKGAEIRVFVAGDEVGVEARADRLAELIAQGRIPISAHNVERVRLRQDKRLDILVSERSAEADLVITGFSPKKVQGDDGVYLSGFPGIHDLLFVHAGQPILISSTS